jgi:dipeptidyl aminopeptidase/acylaminoacyl peptidase
MSLRALSLCAALGATLVSSFAWAAPNPKPLASDDIFRFRELSDLSVAPRGESVLYLLTTNDRDSDERRSAVWTTTWDGHDSLPLTRAAAGIRAPRFSPDGRYVSYVATPPDETTAQLMLLDRRGGEARTLTHLTDDLGDYEWAPDGHRIVLVLEHNPDGATAKPTTKPRPQPIVIDDWHFKEDIVGYLGRGHDRHLALLDVDSGNVESLTTDAAFQENAPIWSPDGQKIAYVRVHEKGGERDAHNEIVLIEAHSGATPRVLATDFAANGQHLAFSPDGSLVAYHRGPEAKWYAYGQDVIAVVPTSGGAVRAVTAGLDRAVMSYVFSADGRSLVASVEDDASVYPVRVDIASGRSERLVPGDFSIEALAGRGDHLAVISASDSTAAEVHAIENHGLRTLTHHNDEFIASVSLGNVEEMRFKSRDGTEVHGLLTKPPGYVKGRRYPTVLLIHGGPNGQDQHSLAFDSYQFRRQLLAAEGYVVLGINYRGSSGRGATYARAIFADWGHKEVEDLLAGVDAAVAAGIADPTRLAIGGWSYGGILTDYTLASDGRFRVAFSGAGSANQLTMYGTDQYVLQYTYELGAPWQNPALWMKLSYPFFHADRIKTPTLFMGGSLDFNVPVAGGEQMYQALKTLGVPTELVVYPDQYHGLTRPSFVKDRLDRTSAWISPYLKTP